MGTSTAQQATKNKQKKAKSGARAARRMRSIDRLPYKRLRHVYRDGGEAAAIAWIEAEGAVAKNGINLRGHLDRIMLELGW